MRGFHLIELLITLTIIAILAAISLPIYSHYTVSAKRLTASAALSALSIAMERYYFLQNTYENATLQQLHIDETTANNQYRLQIDTATHNTYRIAAIPQAEQAQKDKRCGILMLNEKGEQSTTGPGMREECW